MSWYNVFGLSYKTLYKSWKDYYSLFSQYMAR